MGRWNVLLLLTFFISGCGSKTSSSSSNSNSINLSSSSIKNVSLSASNSSSSVISISTPKEIPLEKISIKILNDIIVPNDKIIYDVEFFPYNATYKSFELSTTTPDILRIDDLEVYAKKTGVGKLIVSSSNGLCSDTIDVKVSKKEPYTEILNILNKSRDIEKISVNYVSSNYSYTSSLYSEENNLNWYIYEDSIQKDVIDNNLVKDSYLSFIDEDNLNILIVKDNKSSVELEKIKIGDSTNSITLEEANERISMVEYDNEYGISNYISKMLKDELSFFKDEIVDNIVVNKKNHDLVYEIKGQCEYLDSYLDNVNSTLYLESILSFNEDESINEFSYILKRFTPDYNDYIDYNEPTSIETFNVSLLYGDRNSNIDEKIDINDYKVSSFEIEPIDEIEVGTTVKLNLFETPLLHLKETYRLEIENTSVLESLKELEIKAKATGVSKVKVISSSNIEREIEIKVVPSKVQSISIGYIPYFIEEGDIFEVSATCYPLGAENKEYTMSLDSIDESIASLTKKDNGKYEFCALKAGQVTLRAVASENEEIYDEETINILAKPDVNSLKEKLSQKSYYHKSSTESSEIKFNLDGSGTLKLEGGGEYSFNYDLNEELYLSFTNVVTIKEPMRWYDFFGDNGSYIDRNCTIINLCIYDIDYESKVLLQFI